MKYLLALQYWDGDKNQAIELLELLRDTVPQDNPWADLCIYYRFDSTPPNDRLIDDLEGRFANVYVVKGRQHLTGYPDGSNGLWASLAMDSLIQSTQSVCGVPAWGGYKAIVSIESDVCPISEDWLSILSDEWDNSRPAHVVGAWSKVGEPDQIDSVGHINGNMMFSPNINKLIPTLTPPAGKAWDTYFARDFKRIGWHRSTKIVNWFRHPKLSKEDFENLRRGGVSYLHGVKDDSARKLYLESYDNRLSNSNIQGGLPVA
jgi:hypothetical protein